MRPSEEVALELYKKYGPGSKEAIVGFTFDLGEINDPVYGTAKNLCGELPFPMAPGEFTLPELDGLPATLQKYAEELLPHCRDAFSDLLDDEIIVKLKDYGIACIMCQDISDPHSVKGFMLMLALTWLFDDLVDSEGPDDQQMFNYKSLRGFFNDARAKAQDSTGAVWDMIPSLNGSMESAKAVGKLALSLLEQGCPNIVTKLFKSSPINAEFKLTVQAVYAMKEATKAGKQYSKTTSFELYRYISFTRTAPETPGIYNGLEIPPEIRSDILFQSALNNFSDITCFYNAILGLPRDVRKKQEDGPIMYLVTVRKKSLQKAFDEIYTATTSAFNDYMINTNKLLEVYEDDPSLKKYVESMNSYMAGTLIGYKCMARYGLQDKMDVVTKEM